MARACRGGFFASAYGDAWFECCSCADAGSIARRIKRSCVGEQAEARPPRNNLAATPVLCRRANLDKASPGCARQIEARARRSILIGLRGLSLGFFSKPINHRPKIQLVRSIARRLDPIS